MAARIIFDTVQDSELEATEARRDRVRTGMIIGMDIPSGSTPEAVTHEKALILLQANGLVWRSPISPSFPDTFLQRIRLIPVSAKNFRWAAFYTTFLGVNPTIYTIRQSGIEEEYTGNLLPGNRKPIKGTWTGTVDGKTVTYSRLVTARFSRPVRILTLTMSVLGSPPKNLPEYEQGGSVNHALWLNKQKGYWKLLRFDTDYARFAEYYVSEATVASRVKEDWSDTYIMQDAFGNYVDVSDADATTINGLPYGDIITPPGYTALTGKGLVRVYPFPFVDLGNIFGFTS